VTPHFNQICRNLQNYDSKIKLCTLKLQTISFRRQRKHCPYAIFDVFRDFTFITLSQYFEMVMRYKMYYPARHNSLPRLTRHVIQLTYEQLLTPSRSLRIHESD
jgi:hypothetical protein